MSTLLSHIVPLYGQTEVIATEALRYIFQQSEAARNALQRILSDAGADVGRLARFQTEDIGDKGERVDLACYDAEGTGRVLIESKFWAGLTDNQPGTYIERLPAEGHSVLLFIVPARRVESLWPQLLRRAQEQHETTDRANLAELRVVDLDRGGRKMMAMSWASALGHLASSANFSGDTGAGSDVTQLLGLTQRMDSGAFLPILSQQLGPETPRRISNYLKLVNDAATRIKTKNVVGWSGPLTSSWGSNGMYMSLGDAFAWFGIDYSLWSQIEGSPLWLQLRYFETFDGDDAKSRLAVLEDSGRGLNEVDGQWWIPIDLPTGAEETAVVASVVDRLEFIGNLLTPE